MLVRPLPWYGVGKARSRPSRKKRLRHEVRIVLVASPYAVIFEFGSVMKEITFAVIDPSERRVGICQVLFIRHWHLWASFLRS